MRTAGPRPELLPLELGLFALVFWADEAGYVPLSKTPFLLLVAWGSLWLRGLRWRDVGLSLPAAWRGFAAQGLAAGIAMWLLEFFATMPVLHRVLGYWPDLTAFNELVGNLMLLAVYLVLKWVLAAFGEEMVWRGYALPRARVPHRARRREPRVRPGAPLPGCRRACSRPRSAACCLESCTSPPGAISSRRSSPTASATPSTSP